MQPFYLDESTPMPALTIKNIPDDLYDQLKASAQTHHRSLNSELIHCLESALMPRRASVEQILADARVLRSKVKAVRLTAMDIDAAKNEGRT